MAFIEWNSELDVLVANMNREHKRWIAYINTLYEASKAERGPAEVLRAFDDMQAYTIEHFSHEEEYLQSIDYPIYDVHKAEHTKFLDKIAEEKENFDTSTFQNEFFEFLGDWLVRHIKIVDIRYGEYTERMKKTG